MNRTKTGVQKSLEKLSSGLKINRAADDAAGLAISQKLLAIQRGSSQALRNVEDAALMVQTADSAIQEISSIVNRLRELTIQAMNGTNTQHSDINGSSASTADTFMIQEEIDELKKSLTDIVKGTEFNTKKLLTNTNPGKYEYQDKSISQTINLETVGTPKINMDYNTIGSEKVGAVSETYVETLNRKPSLSNTTDEPQIYNKSTESEYAPRFSEDGNSIVFYSTRDNGANRYIVPIRGGVDSEIDTTTVALGQRTITDDGLMRLEPDSEGFLHLQRRYSTGSTTWITEQKFPSDIGGNTNNYSFSPVVDENGNSSFVYADNEGNISRVDFNVTTQRVTGNPQNLITTNDLLHVDKQNNTLTLTSVPKLYRMNEANASLVIEKNNDKGTRELKYWDETGEPPAEGYYTINGNKVTFHGDAIIGAEDIDDAQDFYTFSYVSDSTSSDIYMKSIPAGAEIYNMDGEAGPRSLKITVGNRTVGTNDLLSVQPDPSDQVSGVFVNETTGKVELYGDWRPAHDEMVQIDYLRDEDFIRDGSYSFSVPSTIDTYNIEEQDLEKNSSVRVYVGGTEINHLDESGNGYTYEDGYIKLHGNARPDITTNETVQISYVRDHTNTTKEVFGIQLTDRYGNEIRPQVYNLGEDGKPNSIRVYRNGTEEIPFSGNDGFQYDVDKNRIELFGTARPDINDTYTIHMIAPTEDVLYSDDKIEIPLTIEPETYGDDNGNPITFKVEVDGEEISYDSEKLNGFYYNAATKHIELYGDARPDAGHLSNPNVKVSYVYESNPTERGNNTYDFILNSNTLDYGVASGDTPRAIRVYHGNQEIEYDAENGFTYDPEKNILSLHGAARPKPEDNTGDYRVYAVTEADLKKAVPANAHIYKVTLNGQEIQETDDPDGDGYVRENGHIQVVGNARPDVTRQSIDLQVRYFPTLEAQLSKGMRIPYLDGEGFMEINEEIVAEDMTVYLDNQELTADQYRFEGDRVLLNVDNITVNNDEEHTIQVDYKVRRGIEYQSNQFTFHVGANSGQRYTIEIHSFDNMLDKTNDISVLTYEAANKSLQLIDEAHHFALTELGGVGAVENRLSHIASTVETTIETTTQALSTIEDADMAKELMNMTKHQILTQAQQAMLAMSKQEHESVLELLR